MASQEYQLWEPHSKSDRVNELKGVLWELRNGHRLLDGKLSVKGMMKKTGLQKDQALGLSKGFWWRGGKLHNYTLRRKEAGQEEIKVIKRREQLKKARLQKNQSEITKQVVGDSY